MTPLTQQLEDKKDYLPISYFHTEEDIEKVVKTLNSWNEQDEKT